LSFLEETGKKDDVSIKLRAQSSVKRGYFVA
jgi:hypothetical protein